MIITFRRTAPVLTGALFTASLAVGVAGGILSSDPLTEAGTLGVLAAVPALYWVMITRTHEVTDQQLEQARKEGYVKALDHVGRGIIDVPPPPSPGQCEHCGRDVPPADVISLDERRRPADNAIEQNRAVP